MSAIPIQFGNCPMDIMDVVANRRFTAPHAGRYEVTFSPVAGVARRTVELPKALLGMSVNEARSHLGERVRIAAPKPFTGRLAAVEENSGGGIVRLTLFDVEMATPGASTEG